MANTYAGSKNPNFEQELLNGLLLRNVEPNLIYAEDCDKATLPEGNGDTIRFTQWNPLEDSVEALRENVVPVGQTLGRRSQTVTLKQYGDYLSMTDVFMQQINRINGTPQTVAAKMLGEQAGRSVDSIVRDIICSTSNRLISGGKTSIDQLSATDTLKVDDILEAMTMLDEAQAYKFNNKYKVITSPRGKLALQRDDDWRQIVDDSTHKKFETGEIGSVYGATFKISNNNKEITPDYYTVHSYTAGTRTIVFEEPIAASIVNRFGDTVPNPKADKLKIGNKLYFKGQEMSITAFTPSAAGAPNAASVTVENAPATAPDEHAKIITGDTTPAGLKVQTTLIYGQHAFARADLGAANVQMIWKALGSGGATDPLNMMASSAWKINGFATTILNPDWVIAIDHVA